MASRDPQRFAVYAAEKEARGDRRKPLNPVHCQLLVQRIRADLILRVRYSDALDKRIRLVLKREMRVSAYAMDDVIYPPKWAQNDYTICHEVSHIINSRVARGRDAHGPEFCRIHLDVVEQVLCSDTAGRLRDAYIKHGVLVG